MIGWADRWMLEALYGVEWFTSKWCHELFYRISEKKCKASCIFGVKITVELAVY